MKQAILVMLIGAAGFSFLVVTGCETEAQNKALIGTAVGAGVGQAVGRDTKATVIGAGVGAGAGYLWGKSQDNKKAKAAQQQGYSQPPQQGYTQPAYAPAPAVAPGRPVSVWVTNSNGSQTEIKMVPNGDGSYTGPKGERYATLPTDQQLRSTYGF